MKFPKTFNVLFLSLMFIFFSISLFGQTTDQKIEIFTKVWGFLKYHHPAVASGKMNWDSVYVNTIPVIEKPLSTPELNKQLLAIISDLGQIQKDKPATLPDSVFTANYNLDWITESKLLNPGLKNKLKEIYKYRNQGENRYIKLKYSTADLSGENRYENMVMPNQDYRLLFLARYWNIINYFAPYKYLIGKDWNNVLSGFIPKMIAATDTVTYYQTLLQLAASVNDGHAFLANSNYDNSHVNDLVFGKYTAPVYIEIVNGTVIIRKLANDTLSNKAGIKKGDIVLSIDNEQISKRINRLQKYISASNNVAKINDLTWQLFDTHNLYQNLTIKRGSKVFKVKIKCILASARDWRDLTRYTFNNKGYKTIGNSIAYVYAGGIWNGNVDSIKSLIKSKKAVIFDSRNYSTNDAFYNIFDMFLPVPKAISLELEMLPDNPGYFIWKKVPMIGNINKSPYNGKVIILADERNQSQGEYSVMALQTIPNSVTIGSQTAGHDGVVTPVPIGGKLNISYSGYGVYYPDKTVTQRQGVKIDIPVKTTIESVLKDQDVILENALKYLKSNGID